MFEPITIPMGCVMLFNTFKLKPNVTVDDVELALGEMCNVVKNTYGNEEGGFIAGQVYEFSGFVREEGSIGTHSEEPHIAIVTYWNSFEQHETSHADSIFKEKFNALSEYVESAEELGYTLMWQGEV
jgi:hypothetical protein